MGRLTKPNLLKIFERGMTRSGLTFLNLSSKSEHPALYQVITSTGSFRVRVYIWNLTFGGRATLPDEWRIQITGLPDLGRGQRLIFEQGVKTTILGWCEEIGVFAAYDIAKHSGPLGGSPSIQIRQPALEEARKNGLAPHFRGGSEAAYAVEPSYLGVYLENMEELHACASSIESLDVVQSICAAPYDVADRVIEQQVPEPRRYAVVAARKAIRDVKFNKRIMDAYSNTCAMCGIQLQLLDAAHILPAAHPESTDETCNGIALCALHHRAFDRGLVTFDSKYKIHQNEVLKKEFSASGFDGGLLDFQARLYKKIEVPSDPSDRPAPIYVNKVNELRGWSF